MPQLTTDRELFLGDRVYYEGNMANAPRAGEVTAMIGSQWGPKVEITWDNPEAIGWEGDIENGRSEAVTFVQPKSILEANICQGARWYFEDEMEAFGKRPARTA